MNTVLNKTEFDKICSQNRFVLVDFSAEWCGPCKRLKPLLKSLFDKLTNINKDIKFIEIDVDKNQEIAENHNVSAMPTIMFYVDGILQSDFVRGADINSIEKYCNKFFIIS